MSTDLSPEEQKARYGYVALDGIPPSMDAWQLGRLEHPLGSFERGRYVLVGVEPAWIELHHQVDVLDENGDPLPGVWVIFGWGGPDLNIPTRTNLWHGAPAVLQGNAQRTNRMGYAQHTFGEGGEDVWVWDVQNGALELPSPIVRSCKWIGTDKGGPFIHSGVKLTFQRRRNDVEPRGPRLDRIDATLKSLKAQLEALSGSQAGGGLTALGQKVADLVQTMEQVQADITFIKNHM